VATFLGAAADPAPSPTPTSAGYLATLAAAEPKATASAVPIG